MANISFKVNTYKTVFIDYILRPILEQVSLKKNIQRVILNNIWYYFVALVSSCLYHHICCAITSLRLTATSICHGLLFSA